jgi:hypothetical protein
MYIFSNRDAFRGLQFVGSKYMLLGPETSGGGNLPGGSFYFILWLGSFIFSIENLMVGSLFFSTLSFIYVFYFATYSRYGKNAKFICLLPFTFYAFNHQLLAMWNPSFLPLVFILILYLIEDKKYLKNTNSALMSLLLVIGLHIHFQTIIIIVGLFFFSLFKLLQSRELRYLKWILLTFIFSATSLFLSESNSFSITSESTLDTVVNSLSYNYQFYASRLSHITSIPRFIYKFVLYVSFGAIIFTRSSIKKLLSRNPEIAIIFFITIPLLLFCSISTAPRFMILYIVCSSFIISRSELKIETIIQKLTYYFVVVSVGIISFSDFSFAFVSCIVFSNLLILGVYRSRYHLELLGILVLLLCSLYLFKLSQSKHIPRHEWESIISTVNAETGFSGKELEKRVVFLGMHNEISPKILFNKYGPLEDKLRKFDGVIIFNKRTKTNNLFLEIVEYKNMSISLKSFFVERNILNYKVKRVGDKTIFYYKTRENSSLKFVQNMGLDYEPLQIPHGTRSIQKLESGVKDIEVYLDRNNKQVVLYDKFASVRSYWVYPKRSSSYIDLSLVSNCLNFNTKQIGSIVPLGSYIREHLLFPIYLSYEESCVLKKIKIQWKSKLINSEHDTLIKNGKQFHYKLD